MTRIYSYILRFDDGAAPNPFCGLCTLTICKPAIRRNAKIGDWVIGTGSKNTKLKDGKTYDFSGSIVYAMKITDKKSLSEYDEFCKNSLTNKIQKWKTRDWRLRVGDCIYDYSTNSEPELIKKNQGHKKIEKTDLIQEFEKWIEQFEKNKLHANPQMRWLIDGELSDEEVSACAKEKLENEEDENEETVC